MQANNGTRQDKQPKKKDTKPRDRTSMQPRHRIPTKFHLSGRVRAGGGMQANNGTRQDKQPKKKDTKPRDRTNLQPRHRIPTKFHLSGWVRAGVVLWVHGGTGPRLWLLVVQGGPLLVINGVTPYNPYKWPIKWVTGATTLLIKVF